MNRDLEVQERTVLIVDRVDSTRELDRLGLVAGSARQLEVLDFFSRLIADHDGTWIKSTGDGAVATFTSSRDALACAAILHRDAPEGAGGGSIRLRIALDRGALARTADDVFGLPVVVASRLCQLANPGEVIVSAPVAKGAACALLEPRGTLALKGLQTPVRAYGYRWECGAEPRCSTAADA